MLRNVKGFLKIKDNTTVFTYRVWIILISLILSAIFIHHSAWAQIYSIEIGIFGNGCGKSSGGGYIVNGTVGQIFVDSSSGSGYSINSGIGHDIFGILLTDIQDNYDHISTLPSEYKLEQNYPNPFNPTTVITFSLPTQSMVSMEIINALGQTVFAPINEQLRAGEYKITINANGLSSGIYFYRIKANDYSQTRKMLLLK
jgi:hypothetical protein